MEIRVQLWAVKTQALPLPMIFFIVSSNWFLSSFCYFQQKAMVRSIRSLPWLLCVGYKWNFTMSIVLPYLVSVGLASQSLLEIKTELKLKITISKVTMITTDLWSKLYFGYLKQTYFFGQISQNLQQELTYDKSLIMNFHKIINIWIGVHMMELCHSLVGFKFLNHQCTVCWQEDLRKSPILI